MSGRTKATDMRPRASTRIALPLTFVVMFFAIGLVGPWIAPYAPDALDLRHEYEVPSAAHWLGTTENGVDILSVLLHGARFGSTIAVLVVAIWVSVGVTFGILAGYGGRKTDAVLMGLADIVQAFPSVLLNIALLALVARPGMLHMVFALSATGWVLYARLSRAQTLVLRERDFVSAARALGASNTRILTRHIAPNLAGPIIVQATTGLGGAILAESTLSFLGLGSGSVSWGALLDQGSSVLLRAPHVALIAGGVIAITVLGFQLSGDILRDAWDPRG